MTGVYWWDPWHTIYSSTMDPSWLMDHSLKIPVFNAPRWSARPRDWSPSSKVFNRPAEDAYNENVAQHTCAGTLAHDWPMIGPWYAMICHDMPWWHCINCVVSKKLRHYPPLCCAAKRLLKPGCSIWKVIGDAHSQEESLKSLCYEFGLPSIPVYTYFAFAMFPRRRHWYLQKMQKKDPKCAL